MQIFGLSYFDDLGWFPACLACYLTSSNDLTFEACLRRYL